MDFQTHTREDGTRIYVKDKKNYVSITTLLSRYEDKTTLNSWKQRIGLEEANRISSEAASRGTITHGQIENFYGFNPENIAPYNPYANIAIEKFYSKVTAIDLESVVFYEHESGARVAGRYDQLLEIQENTFQYKESDTFVPGGLVIADLKTKDKQPRLDKIDYIFKHLLQISAYAKILEQTEGKAITGACIIYAIKLKTKECCRVFYLNKEKIDFYWLCVQNILLDFFKKQSLTHTWKEMIALANCTFDLKTDMFIDYLPREIVASNGTISDFGSLKDS